MSSRDKMIKMAKERERLIDEYIKNNRAATTNGVHTVFQSDKIEQIKVYELPRKLLRLNPNNGRFRAELDVIQEDRRRDNKPLELDPDNKDDNRALQDMIRGEYPSSPERRQSFKKLLNNIKEVAQKTGTNGQEQPGLITYDGILINGNRRWTIMEDLADVNKKKKQTGEPLKYDKMRVARLERGTDKYTLWKNEAKEQISQDSRERYNYVNSALEIKRGFSLLRDQGMSEKKAIIEIAKTIHGQEEKSVVAYLDFLRVADLFLEYTDKKEQYTFLLDSGDEKGIVTILQDVAKEYKKRRNAGDISETDQWLRSLFAFCWFSKERPRVKANDGTLKQLSFGHREYRTFNTKVLGKPDIRKKFFSNPAVRKLDLSNMAPGDAKGFYQAIREYQEEYDIKEDINTPVSLLKKATTALSKVSQDLNGSRKGAMVTQIRNDGGLQHLSDIEEYVKDIRQKMK